MSELLIEIGAEEIPARLVEGAWKALRERFVEAMQEFDISVAIDDDEVYATPRRLALFTDVPEMQPDRIEILKGPAKQVAFDADGKPTSAAEGFARKAGLNVSELEVGGDGKLTTQRIVAGRPMRDLLAEVLPRVVLGVPFPRSMYWLAKGSPRFIRPIRWLVVLLDGEVVPVEIAGVQSGNTTWGHRQLGVGPVAVDSVDSYQAALKSNGVMLWARTRGFKIEDSAKASVPPGCKLRENHSLLKTLIFETESPTAILGGFDESYLDLPDEVLETVMLVHQKYFVVENSSGSLTNYFVAIANTGEEAVDVIRRGHERVLRARFNDARFFWKFDQRTSLEDRVAGLDAVTFQASLGSYLAKTESNVDAAAKLSKELGLGKGAAEDARRAARLAKVDLTTEMVGEFPELQGKVGGLYAAAQGLPKGVADAIYFHYLPLGESGPIPESLVAQVVSLADKLTTLGGMFRIGLIPTGSKDPLALRRAALSVIRIVLEGRLEISLDSLVKIACADESSPKLREFLLDRLRYRLPDIGPSRPDCVEAVLAASDQMPIDVEARAIALTKMSSTPDFGALAVSFKRIRNIVEQSGTDGAKVDPKLLEAGAEADLHAALEPIAANVAEHNDQRDYASSLKAIATLRPALDRYFDDVLVMAEDEAVRKNRLAFLAGMLRSLSTIADFSLIDAEAGESG